jgi:cytoskeleton protein RodZ
MNDQVEVPVNSVPPQSAGARLRHAREAAGLSIADIAARTRITQRQVEHIEQGDYAAFASRTYIIGFARNIARTVGLDPEDVAHQVRSEIGALQMQARPDEAFEPGDPARVPSRSLVWLSLAAAGLLLAGLFMAYRTYFSPAAELPSLVERQEAEVAALAARQRAAASPAAATAAAPSGPVVFTATGDGVWVRFYDAAGQRLLETELARGQAFTVPADANGPMIRTARPELLAITIGGRPVAPLATEMITVSDVKVDATSLLARAPQPGATASGAAAMSANPAAPVRTTPISEGTRLPRPAAARTPTGNLAARRQVPPVVRPAASQDVASANSASAEAAQDSGDASSVSQPAAEAAPAAE